MKEKQEVSFGVIPLKRSTEGWSVFVIRHKRGDHWGFPKGRPSFEETPFESATRELMEETGLVIQKSLVEEPFIEHYTFIREGVRIHKRVEYFPALVFGALFLQHEEIQEGCWLDFSEAQKVLTFPEAKALCAKAQELTEKLDSVI